MRSRATGAALLALCVASAACRGGAGEIPRPDTTDVEAEIVRAVDAAVARVRAEPRSAAAWGGLGDRFLAHEWFAEAAECYERAARHDPDVFPWPYRRGLALAAQEDLQGAAAAFERALGLRPDYAPAFAAYAEMLSRLGRDDEAGALFSRAAQINPRLSHPWVGLGQLALRAGRLQEARDHLERALQRNPDHGEAHHALAQVYMALDTPGLARMHADRARALPPLTPRVDPLGLPEVEPAGSLAHTERARQLERGNDAGGAERHYRAAIGANPEHMPARYGLGRLLARAGRWDEAIEHLTAAARLKSTDRTTLRALAEALGRAGRHGEAVEVLRRLVALEPSDARARQELARALTAAGRIAEARAELEQARQAAAAAGERTLAGEIAGQLRSLPRDGAR